MYSKILRQLLCVLTLFLIVVCGGRGGRWIQPVNENVRHPSLYEAPQAVKRLAACVEIITLGETGSGLLGSLRSMLCLAPARRNPKSNFGRSRALFSGHNRGLRRGRDDLSGVYYRSIRCALTLFLTKVSGGRLARWIQVRKQKCPPPPFPAPVNC